MTEAKSRCHYSADYSTPTLQKQTRCRLNAGHGDVCQFNPLEAKSEAPERLTLRQFIDQDYALIARHWHDPKMDRDITGDVEELLRVRSAPDIAETAVRIAEIRERSEKATGGDWSFEFGIVSSVKSAEMKERDGVICRIYGDASAKPKEEYREWKDGQFIAHAREDIPYLLGLVDAHTKLSADTAEVAKRIAEKIKPHLDVWFTLNRDWQEQIAAIIQSELAKVAPDADDRCLHCDPSYVPKGPDGWCYCKCHNKTENSTNAEGEPLPF